MQAYSASEPRLKSGPSKYEEVLEVEVDDTGTLLLDASEYSEPSCRPSRQYEAVKSVGWPQEQLHIPADKCHHNSIQYE